MGDRKAARVEALVVLRDRARSTRDDWVPISDLPQGYRRPVERAVGEGLAELADRETRAELSALARQPIRWAARLTSPGHDALTYAEASPAPASGTAESPEEGEKLVRLRPAEMDAVRLYMSIGPLLRVPAATGLAERVRSASFAKDSNRWTLRLSPEQIESVAYAFYLHSVSGSVTEANRFAREYGITLQVDDETGTLQPTELGGPR